MLKCEGVKHPSKMISVESEVNHEVKQAIELHIESNVVVGDVNKGQNPYNKQDNRHAGSFVNIFFDSITKYTWMWFGSFIVDINIILGLDVSLQYFFALLFDFWMHCWEILNL